MDLRFPVGEFKPEESYTEEQQRRFIEQVEEAPARLREAVEGLSEGQLDTPYRPGGWTVRQVAHHLPDSHMNGLIRMKLALTEDEPLIKTYMEDRWAELPDYKADPTSRAALDRLARATGGSVYTEGEAGAAGAKARQLLGSGPTVVQLDRREREPLAPLAAAAAFLPLGLLLGRRGR